MHSFEQLAELFKKKFETNHFPAEPPGLYESCNYFLSIGGKRIRPVMCLMGNELFDEINPDAWHVAIASKHATPTRAEMRPGEPENL